ncbi:DUF4230 domain-containing protein [Priestia megaterium]
MKAKLKLILLTALIAIAASFTANTVSNAHRLEPVKIVQQHEEGKYASQMINEETLYGKLETEPEVAPYKQPFTDVSSSKDEKWLGERETAFIVKGTYSSPFKLKDVKIKYIDQENGIVHATSPKTEIKVNIKYKGVSSEKVHGKLRRDMNEEEKKTYIIQKENELEARYNKDKITIKQADLYTQDAIRTMWMKIPNVKAVVFD